MMLTEEELDDLVREVSSLIKKKSGESVDPYALGEALVMVMADSDIEVLDEAA
jgi:hypothetical protein